MKTLIGFLLCLSVGACYATESKLVDGQVQFAIAKAGVKLAWTASERQKMIDDYGVGGGTAATVVDLTPTAYEVAVSTCLGGFASRSDFLACFTKDGLFKRFRSMKADYDLAMDLGDVARILEFRQRYQYLKQFYQALP